MGSWVERRQPDVQGSPPTGQMEKSPHSGHGLGVQGCFSFLPCSSHWEQEDKKASIILNMWPISSLSASEMEWLERYCPKSALAVGHSVHVHSQRYKGNSHVKWDQWFYLFGHDWSRVTSIYSRIEASPGLILNPVWSCCRRLL